MSENTKIVWATHTFNPWEGCQKVGPGCDHCYAEARNTRFNKGVAVNWGPGAMRRRTSVSNWKMPLRWNDQHEIFFAAHSHRQRVFCASLADVFDNDVDPAWRMDLFSLIADTPNLDWLILTKRIGNVMKMCSGDSLMFDMIGERVWLGITVVNQEEADRDIPKLLAVPATKRFLSMEPLLGEVDLGQHLFSCCGEHEIGVEYMGQQEQVCCGRPFARDLLDWVIVGGESGPNARPMHPDWVRSLRDQCQEASVPFMFKQWGEWTPGENVERQRGTVGTAFLWNDKWSIYSENLATDGGHVDDAPDLYRVGKKEAGRHLDGQIWNEVPT